MLCLADRKCLRKHVRAACARCSRGQLMVTETVEGRWGRGGGAAVVVVVMVIIRLVVQ